MPIFACHATQIANVGKRGSTTFHRLLQGLCDTFNSRLIRAPTMFMNYTILYKLNPTTAIYTLYNN